MNITNYKNMKINHKKILTLRGKTIGVVYTSMYETVAQMILQYYDTEEFYNTLFVVNCLTYEDSNDIDFRSYCRNWSKYIYYQLNNLYIFPEYVANEHMSQFDEIWDSSKFNMNYYPEDVKDKVWYMPLRYVNIPKIQPKEEYKYDIGFIGTLTPFRQDMLSRITKYWTDDYCRVKTISGVPYSQLYDEIADCKYLIDLPRSASYGSILNNVRIFETLCSGKQIIAETFGDVENPFTWLIKGYTGIYTIYNIVKEDPADNSEVFKQWTDTDEKYENYRKYFFGEEDYKPRLSLK